MDEQDVLRCAQAIIFRERRGELVGTRAVMSFDPHDRGDMLAWLREKIESAKSDRYRRAPIWAVRNLVFDARQDARRARRQQHHQGKTVFPILGIDGLELTADNPPLESVTSELYEQLGATVSRIGYEMVDAVSKARARKAEAVLSCFGRLTAVIAGDVDLDVAGQFVLALTDHVLFKRLPISKDRQNRFREAALRLDPHGNLRKDLSAVGLGWPATHMWKHFVAALRTQIAGRQRSLDN